MKKFIIYILIIAIGSFGVYFGLAYKDTIKEHIFSSNKKTEPKKSDKKDEKETIPSKDGFISEAIKLQTLAENTGVNETCKCYNDMTCVYLAYALAERISTLKECYVYYRNNQKNNLTAQWIK